MKRRKRKRRFTIHGPNDEIANYAAATSLVQCWTLNHAIVALAHTMPVLLCLDGQVFYDDILDLVGRAAYTVAISLRHLSISSTSALEIAWRSGGTRRGHS